MARFLVVVGLSTGDAVEQKICHINLDRKDTVNVINSTPAKIGSESAACVIINNVLYAVGIGSVCSEMWKWPDERNEWAKLANLPSYRSRHCATSVGKKIYVLGGCLDDGRTLDSVLCYDVESNKWTQVTQLRHAVFSAACVTYKQSIYVFGGFENVNKIVNHVQVYDTSRGEVKLGPNPMPAAQDSLMRAVVWRSMALLIGCDTCYIYDFEHNTWEERERFKTDVVHFGLTLNDDTLYISGGGNDRIDENNETVWTHSDEVKNLSVDDFISDNQQAEWTHHAKLPNPAPVYSFNSQPLFI